VKTAPIGTDLAWETHLFRGTRSYPPDKRHGTMAVRTRAGIIKKDHRRRRKRRGELAQPSQPLQGASHHNARDSMTVLRSNWVFTWAQDREGSVESPAKPALGKRVGAIAKNLSEMNGVLGHCIVCDNNSPSPEQKRSRLVTREGELPGGLVLNRAGLEKSTIRPPWQ